MDSSFGRADVRATRQQSALRSGGTSARMPRTEVCLICGKEFLAEKYESHAERCVVSLPQVLRLSDTRILQPA